MSHQAPGDRHLHHAIHCRVLLLLVAPLHRRLRSLALVYNNTPPMPHGSLDTAWMLCSATGTAGAIEQEGVPTWLRNC